MTEYLVSLCMTVEAPDMATARRKMEGWDKRVKFPDSVKHHEIGLIEEASQ